MLHVVRRDPHALDYNRSRWTLSTLREACSSWLDLQTDSGLYGLMRRLGITYKRGREYVHSPDPDYEAKRAYIDERLQEARQSDDQVLLYQDECTYYRQPTVAQGYEAERQSLAPHADLGHHGSRCHRITGALNPFSGRVIFSQQRKMGTDGLLAFYRQVCAAYPETSTIYLVQDNWPVHFHADVIGTLKKQTWRWSRPSVPDNWPAIPDQPTTTGGPLPIEIVRLPTYASWLNPIEKLWRWMKQEVIHLHRLADQWEQLKQRVATFLRQFEEGSQRLLRYTGLLPN